jgi:membrane protein YqaA with SNARE-associated domain
MVGYALGLYAYELVGRPIVEFYGARHAYLEIQALYREWDAVAVAIAGFTPLPYKVFSIAAGAFRIDFPTFILVSTASRGARFLLVGALIFRFGPGVKQFIDRYFSWLTLIFAVLLAGGFLLLKYAIY